jgi:membrane protease YdiL (CAAX protease family)
VSALLAVVFVLFLAAGALQIARRAGGKGPLDGDVAGVPLEAAAVIFQGAVLLCATAAFSLAKYGAPLQSLGLVLPKRPGAYRYALLVWLGALGVTVLYGLVVRAADIESLQPPDTAAELLGQPGGITAALLLAAVWAPFNEEMFFRAFALPGLARRHGPTLGVVLSSAIFAAFHLHPGALVPTFVLGVALALAYVRSGSVLPSIFIHALHNTVVILLARYAADVNV